jgi:hypothetical protein
LTDIIDSLPAFVTTGISTDDSTLKVKTSDHSLLKDKYQRIFLEGWEIKKAGLKEKHGISGWEAIAYNGTEEKRGISSFGEAGKGGLKIEFHGQEEKAFIWMRGSGTEPVFRIVADAVDEGRLIASRRAAATAPAAGGPAAPGPEEPFDVFLRKVRVPRGDAYGHGVMPQTLQNPRGHCLNQFLVHCDALDVRPDRAGRQDRLHVAVRARDHVDGDDLAQFL